MSRRYIYNGNLRCPSNTVDADSASCTGCGAYIAHGRGYVECVYGEELGYSEFKRWFEKATGMTREQILEELSQPRNAWSLPVLRFVVSILLLERTIGIDLTKIIGGNTGELLPDEEASIREMYQRLRR